MKAEETLQLEQVFDDTRPSSSSTAQYRFTNQVVVVDDDDLALSETLSAAAAWRGGATCGSDVLARSFSIVRVNSPSLTGLFRWTQS